jgi:hypothetical protein
MTGRPVTRARAGFLGAVAIVVAAASVRAQGQPAPQPAPAQPGQEVTPTGSPSGAPSLPPGVIIVTPPNAQPTPQPQPYVVQPYGVPPPAPQPTATAAPPPPVYATDPKTSAREDEDREERPKPSLKIEAGPGLRKLHGITVLGADMRLAVGAQNNRLGHYAAFSFLYGSTEHTLRTWSMMLGYNLDVRVSIVRLGLGLEGGALVVRRASLDNRMYSWGGGIFGHVGVDIADLGRNGHDALYVDLRLAGSLHYGGVGFWGPSLSLGVRF